MARGGGSRGRPSRSGQSGRPARPGAASRGPSKPTAKKPTAKKTAAVFDEPTDPMPSEFVLGAVPGATPGRWIDAWRERMPHTTLDLRPIAFATQRQEMLEDRIDAALVRLPIAREGLHVITLYDEIPVVVSPVDSHLTAADELELGDLVGEILIVPRDDVLDLHVPGTIAPSFASPDDTEQAIAIVAAGIGIVIVPMSLARLHRRKDVAHRPLRDVPGSTVALAWPADRTTPAVDAFVGIVRGRTPNSSRGPVVE